MSDIISRLRSVERRDYRHYIPDVARDAAAEIEAWRSAHPQYEFLPDRGFIRRKRDSYPPGTIFDANDNPILF